MMHIERAAECFVAGLREAATLPPREAARRAHHAGGPTVDDLERRILARRGATH